jgi:hypothetical protein
MGVDFLERTKKTFKRGWDRAAVALATPDLLRREPGCAGVSVAGDIVQGVEVEVGEKLTVDLAPRGLVARRGLTEVVRMPQAPPEVVEAVRQACGVAVGTIEQVHEPAGVAEISIC